MKATGSHWIVKLMTNVIDEQNQQNDERAF